ncbi:hypothetical protein BTZ20_3743 [Rhodococcus sp. MTM3W5.2]|uniref:Ig-like domain-containing protein n=1 Tax=Rhodococcus sp. MTM3W5.2 TaxID=1805827 RepID=UPI000979642C|nr:Ig-like domain-containing protein [Rhodococcus sp. MTM3W5.2]AQA20930.1 hypothetical protein BTZ20_3743 [Rhodococcus sp. MTM3W5.2]
MAHRTTTRTIAAGAATTLALGALAFLTTGVAHADPRTLTWDDGASHFTRTITNETPAPGETITISTKFERTNSTDEKLDWVKDFHPTCLTYVSGSATLTDNSGPHTIEPYLDIQPGFIAADFNATSYRVTVKQNTAPATLSAQYKVGADCARDIGLQTGMDYSGSLGAGNYSTKGPSLTVGKANTTTTLAPVTGAKVGTTSTLTATVTPAASGGTVTFKDGDTIVGTAYVGADGTATAQWSPAKSGNRTISAAFSGTNTTKASTANATVSVAPEAGDGGGSLGSLGSLFGGFGS